MSLETDIAGRSYPRVYKVSRRSDLHAAILEAISESGGKVLYSSAPTRAPFYFGIQTLRGERFGILVYAFRIVNGKTKNRPDDEVRGQLRFGSEESWTQEHPVARDVAGVDITLLLGIQPDVGLFIALDPNLWDPLPMGISFYAKQSNLDAMGDSGWSVWEKDNRTGKKRSARSESGLETLVAFEKSRLLDYVRFERSATDLMLDTALRHSAAEKYQEPNFALNVVGAHELEDQFQLSSSQIMEIIASRTRLSVAVRGGVAEHHLQSFFQSAAEVEHVSSLDIDAMHDFDVLMKSGDTLRVECKNASPNKYADGSFKVEVQKTRASKGNPSSRFYRTDAFDVVAACLYSATGQWVFRFNLTSNLAPHKDFPECMAPMQKVDHTWATSIADLKNAPPGRQE
ncbi:hypothetical protein I6E74_03480 [Salinibacterium sp. SWN139]|uniref:hypothetical protein n=1 Tax=Salinibacterium sp. SWN139 TaxID=2792055 RepID=UPI0018CDE81A|nr:hypothetical protein [Salinibacterium sp. SWN139]MBH0053228.1 hypothetical protein [Salinibacterium sp. SWN139]